MPITFTSFTPSTVAKSAEVNSNFTSVKTLLDGLRPQLHVYVSGVLIVGTNASVEVPIKSGVTLYLSAVTLRCKTAPTGQAAIIDINKNGSSIFSTRPQINATLTTGGSTAVFSVASLTDGDVLTFDIDQVGSTEPGRDLSIGLSFYL